MTTATYIEKSQNWQDETTIYWFDVEGIDVEGFDYDGQYGVVEGRNEGIVHDDGAPVLNDYVAECVSRACDVNNEMRAA